MKAKDGILHIRIETALREKAAKKAARSKKTLTSYICDLIEADTRPIKRSRRSASEAETRNPPPGVSASP
jgi:hypothetical protein